MSKKSQVTLFIILGIFIIIVVVLFFVFKDSITPGGIPYEFQPAYNKFSECLKETGEEGIYFIASQGGYYAPFGKYFIFQERKIPYYSWNSRELIPEIDLVESELALYISDNLDNCLEESDFGKGGFEIEKQNYLFKVLINENFVEVNLVDSIGVRNEKDSIVFKDIKIEIDSDIKNLYDASVEIAEDYFQEPGMICLSCLESISKNYGVYSEAIPFEDVIDVEDNFILYSILNKNSFMEPKIVWRFVVEK